MALVLEGLLILGAIYRFPIHPAWSLVGLATAGAVFVLLLTDSAWSEGEYHDTELPSPNAGPT